MSLAPTLTEKPPAGHPAERTRSSRVRLASLSGRGALAILDQGLISGSNFILSIFLARTLLPQDYGVYALAFEFLLILTVVYTSLVFEPMSVFGASVYREHGREYFGTLLRAHAAGSIAIVLLIAGSAEMVHLVNPASSLAGALVGVGVAGPLVLLFWMARRAFYMKLSPRGALAGGGTYFIVLMCGLYALYRWKLLSPISAFLLLAVGSSTASLFMLKALKPCLSGNNLHLRAGEVLRRHWVYGRWALASAIPSCFFSGAMYYLLLSQFGGMGDAGEMKALLNLNSPVSQAFVAVSLLSLPYASHVYHREGSGSLNRLVSRLTLLYVGGPALYWIVIIAFGKPVVHLLYGGKYTMILGMLPLLAVGSVFRISVSANVNILRAMESPSVVCRIYASVGVLAVLAGVPLVWRYHVIGAVITFTICAISASLFALFTVLRRTSKRRLENSNTFPLPDMN
jgi:O-antigen/teichoic acid export membrane protein